MTVINLCRGGWGSNCYVVTDESGKYAVVIDPSAPPAAMPKSAGGQEPLITAILLTHAHYDHMLSLNLWREMGIPVYVTAEDAPALADPELNVSEMICGEAKSFSPADRLLGDGDVIALGKEQLKVMLTPGHTKGSCCFLGDGMLFCGDTIFSDGDYGRCDLPGGSYAEIRESISRILSLPPDTRLFPGHMQPTTVGTERYFHGIV
jgi:glyoxylase-like metal-dependent hydrolase (beta-lactamase superfamily II)